MGVIWKLVVWAVLLGLTAGLSVAFGPVVLIICVLLCRIQSASFRRREQNRQHKELLAAMKSKQ